MLFDFQAYLSRIDPTQSYHIVQLSGGVVNVTVRAVKDSSSASGDGLFAAHRTIVLKYAPPYVAGVGKSLPFSTLRQTVEARALALFTLDGPLHDICSESSISIPQLLYHDIEANVLVMSDLGPLHTLSTYFSSMGSLSDDAGLLESRGYELGSRLGRFFGHLHSSDTLEKLGPVHLARFADFTTDSLVFQAAVEPIEKNLQRFGVQDASDLSIRVTQDFERVDRVEERGFCLGDLWTGGVLVNAAGEDGDTLGVIDWEFSGIGRIVNGDMAQLLSDLHLHLMSWPVEDASHTAVEAFIRGMVQSYRSTSRSSHWTIPTSSALNAPGPLRPAASSASACIMRSAFILHGRELINMALWRDWPGQAPDKDTCPLIRRMIERGAWYIRTAGLDEEAFVEAENWSKVIAKDNLVSSLFLEE